MATKPVAFSGSEEPPLHAESAQAVAQTALNAKVLEVFFIVVSPDAALKPEDEEEVRALKLNAALDAKSIVTKYCGESVG